jgi:hypothetical protein
MNKSFEDVARAAELLRTELLLSPPSKALREVAARLKLGRSTLGLAAVQVYENILTPEVQAIWHWDLDQKGSGHSDYELDQLLSHLVLAQESPRAV